MTDPQPTQADREAAALIVRTGAPGLGNGNKVIADEIKGELHDNYSAVQAFTRHAAEREAQVIAAVVAWLKAGFDTYPHGTYQRCREMQSYWDSAADALDRGDWKGPRHAK